MSRPCSRARVQEGERRYPARGTAGGCSPAGTHGSGMDGQTDMPRTVLLAHRWATLRPRSPRRSRRRPRPAPGPTCRSARSGPVGRSEPPAKRRCSGALRAVAALGTHREAPGTGWGQRGWAPRVGAQGAGRGLGRDNDQLEGRQETLGQAGDPGTGRELGQRQGMPGTGKDPRDRQGPWGQAGDSEDTQGMPRDR